MLVRQRHVANQSIMGFKPWYFLIVAGLTLVISVAALRNNNTTMIRLRDAVVVADQQNADVELALQDLRRHVYSHMNTDLSSGNNAIKPPIQLKARYERLAGAEQERIKQANTATAIKAEAVCAGQYPSGGYNAPRVACVQEYMRVNAQAVASIPDSLYKFDFVSPRWSPDLAGISLLLSLLSFVLFIGWYAFLSRRH